MRVLFASTAGTGHFGPMVPVARACAEAGHEVVVVAPASFARHVRDAGLTHLPCADVPEDVMGSVMARLLTLSTEEADLVMVRDVFARLNPQTSLPDVTAIVADWHPDLVLREPCEFASLAAALAAGVPHAVIAISVEAMMDDLAALIDEPMTELDALAGLLSGTCLAGVRGATMFTSVPGVVDAVRPPSATERRPLHRYREPAAVDAGSLPDPWGDPTDPLAYVTFGSVAGALPPFAGIYQSVLDVLAAQPIRVLLTTGRAAQIDALEIPPNACVRQWWPQAEVMPHAAITVGHGGFGTTMAAYAAGMPQVVLPLFTSDQRLNADHVEAVGAGIAVRGGPAGVAELPRAIAAALEDPRYRIAARSVAAEIAGLPPVAEVVRLLDDLAATAAAG